MADRLYLTMQDDMIDLIAWRFYGTSSGPVEAILGRNYHDEVHALSSQPEVLPAARLVLLPQVPKKQLKFVQVWDVEEAT